MLPTVRGGHEARVPARDGRAALRARPAVLVSLAAVVVVLLVACGGATGASPAGSPVAAGGPTTGLPRVHAPSGLPYVELADLPAEAATTVERIASDGPFPYRQDGAAFGNREGLLPPAREGFYREYTVETPGSPDRGARRIVAAADGTLYWTADHYDSFSVIRP